MTRYTTSPTKPNPLVRLTDFMSRAARGQLHLPPWWLRDVGPSDFEATGQEFLNLFIQLGKLQPDEWVLDIGCGCGRMALPLTRYLSPAGFYLGMDITQNPLLWCQEKISGRFPNFQFLHMDLYNKRYNPQGNYLAKDYVFPFQAESFDFIFLTSVFTHLLPEDTQNYLREIARLKSPKGRVLMTFFLLNPAQQELARQGLNEIDFKYGSGPYRLRNELIPESAVAYEEAYLRELIAQAGLSLAESHYGRWSGRVDGLSFQDILIV
jgi:ubiquinone/menaquinone biosynthesis C-methylase UbiE